MRADKAKVVDEIWDDERIASFLDKGAMGTENEQFSQLLHAYRSMRAEDFSRFIGQFRAQGGDVQAKSADGRTLAEVITPHTKAQPFLDILAASQT